MELTIIVEQEPGGYWSQVSELPGCFAAARTLSELHAALGEAVGLYLWDVPARLEEPAVALGESTVRVLRPPAPGGDGGAGGDGVDGADGGKGGDGADRGEAGM
jgi:predicted RNase H-like HicB family nuclease